MHEDQRRLVLAVLPQSRDELTFTRPSLGESFDHERTYITPACSQVYVVRIVDRASDEKSCPVSYGWLFKDGTHLLSQSSTQLALCLAAEVNPI